MSLQALIFDVDGTLAETERDGHRLAFNRAFADAGLDWQWSPEHYGKLLAIAGGKERILHHIADHCADFTPPQPLNDFVAELHRLKTAHYIDQLHHGKLPLRPGVLRLINEATAAGVRLAIATTSALEPVQALLDHAGLGAMFEVIAAGDVVANKKPAPDIFHYALQALQLTAADCAVIEDSANGVQAAIAAGCTSVVVTVSHYSQQDDFSGAALVVDQLGEPGQPAQVLAGTRRGDYVTLDWLQALHAQLPC